MIEEVYPISDRWPMWWKAPMGRLEIVGIVEGGVRVVLCSDLRHRVIHWGLQQAAWHPVIHRLELSSEHFAWQLFLIQILRIIDVCFCSCHAVSLIHIKKSFIYKYDHREHSKLRWRYCWPRESSCHV